MSFPLLIAAISETENNAAGFLNRGKLRQKPLFVPSTQQGQQH